MILIEKSSLRGAFSLVHYRPTSGWLLPFSILAAVLILGSVPAPSLWAQGNDACLEAPLVEFGDLFLGDLSDATSDGSSTCDGGPGTRDLWYRWIAPSDERSFVQGGARDDIELSIHTGCPGNAQNQVACGYSTVLVDVGELDFLPQAGETYYLRVAEKEPSGTSLDPFFLSFIPGGEVTGIVTDSEGQPLADIPVAFGSIANPTLTDQDGRYRLGGLFYGSSFLYAGFDSPYVAEIYDDIPCPNLECFATGDLITASPGAVATANFSLEPGAAIGGQLLDGESGVPIADEPVTLTALDDELGLSLSTRTDGEGRYLFDGLAAGDYAILAGGESYMNVLWDGIPCLAGRCDVELATPISLGVGERVDGLDFSLLPGLSIRGQIRDSTGAPVAFESVLLLDAEGEVLAGGGANVDGEFDFARLISGTYYVQTTTLKYVDEIWPGVTCRFPANCAIETATPIQLESESVDGIDFQLDLGGVLRGTFRNETTGASVENVRLSLYDINGTFLATFFRTSDPLQIEGLPSAEYFAVGSSDTTGLAAELYDSIDCPGGPETCSPIVVGTPIDIIAGEETEIEFNLEQIGPTCEEDSKTLCLNDGRFAVTTTWSRGPNAGSGDGLATKIPGIDDSGSFVFFNGANVEVVVKVLDACVAPFNRFWVFAAGLTNVEVELKVVDTLTGDEKTYFNPLETAFQPIQDTDAFETCTGAGVPIAGAPTPAPDSAAVLEALEAGLAASQLRAAVSEVEGVRLAAAEDSPAEKADCVPSATNLCLGIDFRFQVEATWQTPDGDSGAAMAVPFLRDTGMFWFFGPSNVEMIVKVLDACADPFDRFWVFAGGLTNVDVQLKVTDTVTGETRVYRNPQGQRFQPIQDTDAFATCP